MSGAVTSSASLSTTSLSFIVCILFLCVFTPLQAIFTMWFFIVRKLPTLKLRFPSKLFLSSIYFVVVNIVLISQQLSLSSGHTFPCFLILSISVSFIPFGLVFPLQRVIRLLLAYNPSMRLNSQYAKILLPKVRRIIMALTSILSLIIFGVLLGADSKYQNLNGGHECYLFDHYYVYLSAIVVLSLCCYKIISPVMQMNDDTGIGAEVKILILSQLIFTITILGINVGYEYGDTQARYEWEEQNLPFHFIILLFSLLFTIIFLVKPIVNIYLDKRNSTHISHLIALTSTGMGNQRDGDENHKGGRGIAKGTQNKKNANNHNNTNITSSGDGNGHWSHLPSSAPPSPLHHHLQLHDHQINKPMNINANVSIDIHPSDPSRNIEKSEFLSSPVDPMIAQQTSSSSSSSSFDISSNGASHALLNGNSSSSVAHGVPNNPNSNRPSLIITHANSNSSSPSALLSPSSLHPPSSSPLHSSALRSDSLLAPSPLPPRRMSTIEKVSAYFSSAFKSSRVAPSPNAFHENDNENQGDNENGILSPRGGGDGNGHDGSSHRMNSLTHSLTSGGRQRPLSPPSSHFDPSQSSSLPTQSLRLSTQHGDLVLSLSNDFQSRHSAMKIILRENQILDLFEAHAKRLWCQELVLFYREANQLIKIRSEHITKNKSHSNISLSEINKPNAMEENKEANLLIGPSSSSPSSSPPPRPPSPIRHRGYHSKTDSVVLSILQRDAHSMTMTEWHSACKVLYETYIKANSALQINISAALRGKFDSFFSGKLINNSNRKMLMKSIQLIQLIQPENANGNGKNQKEKDKEKEKGTPKMIPLDGRGSPALVPSNIQITHVNVNPTNGGENGQLPGQMIPNTPDSNGSEGKENIASPVVNTPIDSSSPLLPLSSSPPIDSTLSPSDFISAQPQHGSRRRVSVTQLVTSQINQITDMMTHPRSLALPLPIDEHQNVMRSGGLDDEEKEIHSEQKEEKEKSKSKSKSTMKTSTNPSTPNLAASPIPFSLPSIPPIAINSAHFSSSSSSPSNEHFHRAVTTATSTSAEHAHDNPFVSHPIPIASPRVSDVMEDVVPPLFRVTSVVSLSVPQEELARRHSLPVITSSNPLSALRPSNTTFTNNPTANNPNHLLASDHSSDYSASARRLSHDVSSVKDNERKERAVAITLNRVASIKQAIRFRQAQQATGNGNGKEKDGIGNNVNGIGNGNLNFPSSFDSPSSPTSDVPFSFSLSPATSPKGQEDQTGSLVILYSLLHESVHEVVALMETNILPPFLISKPLKEYVIQQNANDSISDNNGYPSSTLNTNGGSTSNNHNGNGAVTSTSTGHTITITNASGNGNNNTNEKRSIWSLRRASVR